MYSSSLSLTSVLYQDGWLITRPGRFTPEKRPGASCIEGSVGARTIINGCGKYRSHRNFFFYIQAIYKVVQI